MYEQQIERGIELLKLCQKLQSEADGVDRPDPFVINKTKTLDQFAQDIGTAITNMSALYKFFPMSLRLAELGRKLEAEGKVEVDFGGDYAEAAVGMCWPKTALCLAKQLRSVRCSLR
ncbi:hypothetical protein ACPRNU_22450 [Chromobacterium vaccinii]|uniref:hypothetical protein n=1 Tax=Chromobacterium vaccinii TaxID=1108595 RepID=UPI003C766804